MKPRLGESGYGTCAVGLEQRELALGRPCTPNLGGETTIAPVDFGSLPMVAGWVGITNPSR